MHAGVFLEMGMHRFLIPALGLCWFAAIFANCAWLYEDAFISFRSIEQMYAGNGPVWNPDERVQVFTSAGWYWLGYLARLFTADYMLATLFWSALCCAGMLALLRRFFTTDLSWLAIVVLLTASRGVMDFSTSGLENPLGYLLVVAFAWYWREALGGPRPSRAALVKMFLVAALIPLARHDLVLLVIPACVQALWLGRRSLSIGQWALLLAAAAAPLLLWTGFSLVYYGMPFPNTYYAKAATGIERIGLVQVGINYYLVNLFFDPVTVIGVLAGTYYLLRGKQMAIGLGLLLNLLYVLWLGGDYMLTRFLTYSFIIVLACGGQSLVDKVRGNLRVWQKVVLVGLMVLLSLALWQGVLQKIIQLVIIAIYQGLLKLGGISAGMELDELTQLNLHGLLLCMLLMGLLIWIPGAKRLQNIAGISVRTVNSIAFVIAGLVYLQFNPSAALHLGSPAGHSVFSVTQIRYAFDTDKYFGAGVWLKHHEGKRIPNVNTSKDFLINSMYLEGKSALLSSEFPDFPWRIIGEYISKRTDLVITGGIGLLGHGFRLDGNIYDVFGLAEPYLSRLPTNTFSTFQRVAHWSRSFPPEYFDHNPKNGDWRSDGDYQRLAYDVWLATRDRKLWTEERWRSIWRLTRNRYSLPKLRDVKNIPAYIYLFRKDKDLSYLSVISSDDGVLLPLSEVIQRNWQARQISFNDTQAVHFVF